MNIRFDHLNSNLNFSDVQRNDRFNQFYFRKVSVCAHFIYTICFIAERYSSFNTIIKNEVLSVY